MNKTINEIINNYTSGKTPVEDTNKALKEAGAGFSSGSEIRNDFPEDTGTAFG